jgi:hypothetical protein
MATLLVTATDEILGTHTRPTHRNLGLVTGSDRSGHECRRATTPRAFLGQARPGAEYGQTTTGSTQLSPIT